MLITKVQFENELKSRIEVGDLPDTIYKFRLWDDEPNDHILKKRTIRLTSPREMLADYEETYLPIDESLITEKNLLKQALFDAQMDYPTKHISFQKMKAKEYRGRMVIEDPNHRRAIESEIIKRNDEILGIFCASRTYSDMEMWVYRSDNGKGFSVGLDTLNTVAVLKTAGGIGIGVVDYYTSHDPPKVSPFAFCDQELEEMGVKKILSVPNKFEYENEIRIFRHNHSAGVLTKYREEDRIVELPLTCYRDILLGFDISDMDKLEILKFRDAQLKDIPVYTTIECAGKIVKDKLL